jgi:cation:H+ antiporter
LTLVALATSAELFALMWAARRHEVTELALAALIGSVVGNATLTIGMAAVVRPLDTDGVIGPAWLAAALCVLFLVPALWAERWRRLVGALLVVGYVLFVVVVL